MTVSTEKTRYGSTRGQAPETGFSDILLAGLASDGGLYLPTAWPQVSVAEQAAFASASYVEVARRVLTRFTDVAEDDVADDIAAAYSGFEHPAIAPLVEIGPDLYLLELFHGPTLAFKDIALQVLGRMFARALRKRGGRATVVAATSGDTGSAAIAALGGLPNIEVFVLHPKGRVSEVQRRQMTTSPHANVHNVALEGTFDDAQAIVKALFADEPFASTVGMTAVNSINFARIAAQCVYYFTATAALGRPATFVVPTGNFGDVFAGEAAMRMGLPIEKLVVATNANDIMYRVLETGVYAPGSVQPSLSPSMDIQVASNFERALFEASGRDSEWLRAAMAGFARDRRLELPPHVRTALAARYAAARCDDSETLATIARAHRETGHLIDPHTAVALNAAYRMNREAGAPVVVLSTAHPAKFPDAVAKATGVTPTLPSRLASLFEGEERCITLPNDKALVRAHIESMLAL
ncbi:MAG: threonine synthase [Proteobacteria bacterium]|nr:threonine synthase [Pseudomonadota bacterium]